MPTIKECPAINQTGPHPNLGRIVYIIGNRLCADFKPDLDRQNIGRSQRNDAKRRDFVTFDLGIKRAVGASFSDPSPPATNSR